MSNTCSQCSKNKKGDTEFGSNLSCYCDHGHHSTTAKACSDFSPMLGCVAEGYIQSTPRNVNRVFVGEIKPEDLKPKEESGVLTQATPIIGYTIAIAIVLIIASLAFIAPNASLSFTTSGMSILTTAAPLLILVALLFGIAQVAKPAGD